MRLYGILWALFAASVVWADTNPYVLMSTGGPTGGGDNFPVIEGTQLSAENSNVTTVTVDLPTPVSAGNLLICGGQIDGSPGESWPGSWTALVDTGGGGSEANIYYLIASGGETTVNISLTLANRAAFICYRISNYSGTPECSSLVEGAAGTDPDPPSFSPSWGALDTLWLAYGAVAEGSDAGQPSAPPTNYSGLLKQTGGTDTGGVSVAMSHRKLNAASENPGAYDYTSAQAPDAATCAVRP